MHAWSRAKARDDERKRLRRDKTDAAEAAKKASAENTP
jgi:hypothetical protein